MRKEKLYNRNRNILEQAYFNDNLVVGDPKRCAIGSIVCSVLNIDSASFPSAAVINNNFPPGWGWYYLLYRIRRGWLKGISLYLRKKSIRKEIRATGYSIRQIMRIEKTFERSHTRYIALGYKDPIFSALVAVIGVLDDIHGNTPNPIETSKSIKVHPLNQ